MAKAEKRIAIRRSMKYNRQGAVSRVKVRQYERIET